MGSETELGKGICPADNRLPDAFSMPDEVEDALVCLAPRKVTLRGVAACKKMIARRQGRSVPRLGTWWWRRVGRGPNE